VVITLEAVPPPLPPEPPEAQPTVIEAERLFYDQKRDVYHAEGTVVVTREGNLLTADEVEVKRKEEKMDALGKVTFKRADGDVIHGDKMSMSLAGKQVSSNKGKSLSRRRISISVVIVWRRRAMTPTTATVWWRLPAMVTTPIGGFRDGR